MPATIRAPAIRPSPASPQAARAAARSNAWRDVDSGAGVGDGVSLVASGAFIGRGARIGGLSALAIDTVLSPKSRRAPTGLASARSLLPVVRPGVHLEKRRGPSGSGGRARP